VKKNLRHPDNKTVSRDNNDGKNGKQDDGKKEENRQLSALFLDLSRRIWLGRFIHFVN